MDHVPQVLLAGAEVREVANDLELSLRTGRRNGCAPRAEQRTMAAKVGAAVPLVAITLPGVLNAMGPEAAAMVRAQASGAAGSAARPRPSPLTASEASRAAGVSARAVRAAAQAGRLRAVRHKHTNEWQITPDDLREWMASRAA